MNLMYEQYPTTIMVGSEDIPIITDFRECVRLMEMLKDDALTYVEKAFYINQYFLKPPPDFGKAVDALVDFIVMKSNQEIANDNTEIGNVEKKKEVYSFEYDYPFIFSAFLGEYKINIQTVPYMHWWEFKLLFEGLPESTEIKQRIMYRSIDLSTIQDKKERERIRKIQEAIRLPQAQMNDYDIGNAFGW